MKLAIEPLTRERWDDLETLFRSKGCSVARGCWCMFYRHSGAQPRPSKGVTLAERNRRQLKELVDAGEVAGLIGYHDGVPVGWVSLGPREKYLKLQRSPVMKAVDDLPVWAIVCFVVAATYRGQGVARAMLDGAIAYARKHGVKLLEAYPVDKANRSNDDSMWFGAKHMYDTAGLEEVARRTPTRPVVRIRPV